MENNCKELILSAARDLLAAAKATNENEAAGNAAHIQEMIVMNRITGQVDRGGFGETPLDEIGIAPLEDEWIGILAHNIAVNNDCWAKYAWGKGGRTVAIIGRELDRQLCAYMAIYLIREIRRLANDACVEPDGTMRRNRWKGAFGRGAALAVINRLREERLKAQDQFGLVLASERQELSEYFEAEYGIKMVSGKVRQLRSGDHDAYQQGITAGRRIEIRKGMK